MLRGLGVPLSANDFWPKNLYFRQNNPLTEGEGGRALFPNDFYPSSSIQGGAGRELYFYSVSNLVVLSIKILIGKQNASFTRVARRGSLNRLFSYNRITTSTYHHQVSLMCLSGSLCSSLFALFSTAGALVVITVSGVSPITQSTPTFLLRIHKA